MDERFKSPVLEEFEKLNSELGVVHCRNCGKKGNILNWRWYGFGQAGFCSAQCQYMFYGGDKRALSPKDKREKLESFIGKKVSVEIVVPEANVKFVRELTLCYDSLRVPPDRLEGFDRKGNAFFVMLDDEDRR